MLLMAAVWFGLQAPFGLNVGEDGGTLYLFDRTRRGEIPHLDFISGYGAAYFYWHAAILRWLGTDLLSIRWVLAVVNATNTALLFVIGRWLMPRSGAVAGAVAYVVMLPVVTTTSCSFNVPYPCWYTLLFWLTGLLLLDRWRVDQRRRWLVVVGALCALSFAFKPNTGAFNLIAVALSIVVVVGPSWSLLRSLLVVAAGFVLVVLPVVLREWWLLGWSRLLRDVLFVGAGFEQLFYIPYRVQLATTSSLLIGGLIWARFGRRVSWLAPAGLCATVVGVLVVAVAAPMPDGFVVAVRLRAEEIAFAVVLAALVLTFVLLLERRRADAEPLVRAQQQRHWFVFSAALLLLLGVYPRSDYFHLSYSAPLVWVLAAALLWRFVAPSWVCGAAAILGLGLVALPQAAVVAQVLRYLAGQPGLERLTLKRAPVLARQDGFGRPLRDLVSLVRRLDELDPDSHRLVTFPDLDLVAFLSARAVPTRIGYFYPGWPDHQVEAEVVAALCQQPPPLAVVADPPPLFFADAPAYFLLLRQFLETRYQTAQRFGENVLLQRRAAGAGQAATFLPEPVPELTDVEEIRAVGRPSEVLPLVETWNAAVGRRRLTFLRVIGERGDYRAAWRLATYPLPAAGRENEEFRSALFNIALRQLLRGPISSATAVPSPSLIDTAVAWQNEPDVRLRVFAAWLIGMRHSGAEERRDAAQIAWRDPQPLVRLAVAAEWFRSDDPQEVFRELASQMAAGSPLAPLVLRRRLTDLCGDHASACIEEIAASDRAEMRAVAMVLAATGVRGVEKFVARLLSDPDPRVRSAAEWAQRLRAQKCLAPEEVSVAVAEEGSSR